MIGILCEKFSQAQNYSKAMTGVATNINRPFSYDGKDFIITHAAGHVYTWKDPQYMVSSDLSCKYKNWSVENLPWNESDFTWRRKPIKGKADLIRQIKDSLKGCDEIWIACDWDKSGEGALIGAEIIFENKLQKKVVRRLHHIDETKKEIQKALSCPILIKDLSTFPEYRSALFRSQWDYLSIQETRILTSYAKGKEVYYAGRLKSFIVAKVGDQEQLVKDHKDSFFFQNRFIDENKIIYTSKKEKKEEKESAVRQIYESSPVRLVSTERKYQNPPKMMDIMGIVAKLAPRGYSPSQVTKTYQAMYNNHVVSYPRPDENFISPGQFYDLLRDKDKIADVCHIDKHLLTHTKPRGRGYVEEGGSHGANRPAENIPTSLEALESEYGKCGVAIYTLVAKSALSLFAENYEYDLQTAVVEKYPDFIGTAEIPISFGWKAIYGKDIDEDDVSQKTKGVGTCANPFVYKGENPKPKKPTMIWLKRELEKAGVGTGATRATTVATLCSTKQKTVLLQNNKGILSLTPAGQTERKLIHGSVFETADITKEVDRAVAKIQKGDLTVADKLLKEFSDIVRKEIAIVQKNGGTVSDKKVETFTVKTEDGEQKIVKREFSGHIFTDNELRTLVNKEPLILTLQSQRKGKPYRAKLALGEYTFKGKRLFGVHIEEFLKS